MSYTIDKNHDQPLYTLAGFEEFLKTEAGKKLSPEQIKKTRAALKQAEEKPAKESGAPA